MSLGWFSNYTDCIIKFNDLTTDLDQLSRNSFQMLRDHIFHHDIPSGCCCSTHKSTCFDLIRVVGKPVKRHTDIKTLPYPGFPTDMQPQMAVTLALANGTSMVTESIFENRFKYVDEMARMGSHIKVEGNVAVIDGVAGFTGAQVNAPDLRAGAALVIAGLAAEGYTTVDEIGYIQRGYECFEEKLQALGAVIEKVDSEREVQKFKLRVG